MKLTAKLAAKIARRLLWLYPDGVDENKASAEEYQILSFVHCQPEVIACVEALVRDYPPGSPGHWLAYTLRNHLEFWGPEGPYAQVHNSKKEGV